MTDLERAASKALNEIRRQQELPLCTACDPGSEGPEVMGEIADDLEAALKAQGVVIFRRKS